MIFTNIEVIMNNIQVRNYVSKLLDKLKEMRENGGGSNLLITPSAVKESFSTKIRVKGKDMENIEYRLSKSEYEVYKTNDGIFICVQK